MKKFLLGVFLFSVLSIGMLLMMDILESNHLKHSSSRTFAAWRDLMEGNIVSDVIILGSSRAWVHYSPAILDSILHCNSYNLGIDGSSLNRQITKYELYRLYNNKPRLIVLNIDYFSFEFTQGYESYQYFPFFCNQDVRRNIFPQESFSFAEKWIPFYRYTHLGLGNIPEDSLSLYKGYYGVTRSWNGKKLKEMAPFKLSMDPRTIDSFNRFLAQAVKEGITLVFSFSPIYYKVQDLVLDKEIFEKMLFGYQNKYAIPVFRYDKDPICRDTLFFYNATHLNRHGSERFTRQLAWDISPIYEQVKPSKD